MYRQSKHAEKGAFRRSQYVTPPVKVEGWRVVDWDRALTKHERPTHILATSRVMAFISKCMAANSAYIYIFAQDIITAGMTIQVYRHIRGEFRVVIDDAVGDPGWRIV